MNKDAPAFDFYPERWLVGTAAMTDAEQISYLRLICHQWTMDGLPDDVAVLRRLGGKGVTDAVLDKFPLADGKRRNGMLEMVRETQRERIRKSREKIEKMNTAKESRRVSTRGSTRTSTRESTRPLLSASSPLTTHPVDSPLPSLPGMISDDGPNPKAPEAERIVSLYPGNGNRYEAARACLGHLEGGDSGEIERRVREHAKRWRSLPPQHRRYCPQLVTYFSEKRWLDDPESAPWTIHEALKSSAAEKLETKKAFFP